MPKRVSKVKCEHLLVKQLLSNSTQSTDPSGAIICTKGTFRFAPVESRPNVFFETIRKKIVVKNPRFNHQADGFHLFRASQCISRVTPYPTRLQKSLFEIQLLIL